MTISIETTHHATGIFICVLLALVLFSIRRIRSREFFPPSTTTELKGFAIIGIILSHIGYFLVDDHSFLFPLTIIAGVCVDLFLFLSGYGLTIVSIKTGETRAQFYKNRLLRLMIPFWLVSGAFILMDFFVLDSTYPWTTLIPAVFGIFTSADIYHDLNSPLWYFTWILSYYILFSIFFSRKRPWATALALLALPSIFLFIQPSLFNGVIGLYLVHCVAFPLGIFVAWLRTHQSIVHTVLGRLWNDRMRNVYTSTLYFTCIALLLTITWYTILHSGVGSGWMIEQAMSLVTMTTILALFALKRIESRVLYLFGFYSYELYLLHWPILYRYDFLYMHIPGWLATLMYLALFLLVGWVVRYLSERTFTLLTR